jgi:uncharacterized Zn-finger protein
MNNKRDQSIRHLLKSKLNQVIFFAFLILNILLAIFSCFAPSQYALLVVILVFIVSLGGYCIWQLVGFRKQDLQNSTESSRSSPDVFEAIPNNEASITCPDCGMSFPLLNATRLSENTVLCPVCGARLRVGKS